MKPETHEEAQIIAPVEETKGGPEPAKQSRGLFDDDDDADYVPPVAVSENPPHAIVPTYTEEQQQMMAEKASASIANIVQE